MQNTRTRTSIGSGTTSVTNRYVMSNSSAISYRNGIRCDATISSTDPVTFYCDQNYNGTGNESNDGQSVACNYLLTFDILAYLDWVGLRPMAELEYEKACRGTASAVADEFSWGNTDIFDVVTHRRFNFDTDIGTAGERLTGSGPGEALYSLSRSLTDSLGPFRTGIFATNFNDRSRAGASYYGIMELSGNVSEMVVAVTTSNDRAYTGTHGDGKLASNGNADTSNWPSAIINHRGGNWNSERGEIRVSSRYEMNMTNNGEYIGGRGIRTAP